MGVLDGLKFPVMKNTELIFLIQKMKKRNLLRQKWTQLHLFLQHQRYSNIPIVLIKILTPADLAKLEELRAKAIVEGPSRTKKPEKYSSPSDFTNKPDVNQTQQMMNTLTPQQS